MLDTLGKQYVPELDLNYRFYPGRHVLEFDDGVEYTLREALILAHEVPQAEDIRAIHLVKKVFKGVLMTEKEIKDFLLWFPMVENKKQREA